MKHLLLFSLAFFFFNSNTFTQTLTADQIYSKTNNAIVTIYTFDTNDNPISQGSGVVLNQKGWVVTNYHVYEGASKIVVKHANKIVAYSNIVAMDAEKDILILKIVDRSFPSIPIGNSDLLKVGQKVYAIGSPLGLENTISEGIVSGLRTNQEKTKSFIQISAAISPGSSGGAVLTSKGELIAITTSTITKGQNLNFAIPVNDILEVYNKTNIKQNNSIATENGFLYPVFVNNKWGYINNLGRLIIKPQFDYGDDFFDGLAKIEISQKYGFIDKTGKVIINPQFDDIGNFQEGMARVKLNGKYGFINNIGEIAVYPQYLEASNFSDGLAKVIEEHPNIAWQKGGYIDKNGKLVIRYAGYDFKEFSEGLAPISKNGKYGFIDKKASTVISL